MISVQEVIGDVDMIDPQPYVIQRSTGQWVSGGFQSTIVRTINVFGPVRNATDKEVQMLPESDRISRIRAFYATQPILTTRGYAPLPATHGEVPAGTMPGTAFTLSAIPPGGACSLYLNGVTLQPVVDYLLTGAAIVFNYTVRAGAVLYATWGITARVEAAESDVILYDNEQYRVLGVYRTQGAGYLKALAHRMEAA